MLRFGFPYKHLRDERNPVLESLPDLLRVVLDGIGVHKT